MVKYIISISVLLPVLVISHISCTNKKEPEEIVLPPISALAFGSDWGVVTTNYLRIREKPTKQSPSLHGLTKGMVVEIITSTGRQETVEEKTASWYNINMDGLRGWVFGAYLQIFNSKKAATAYAGELQ